MGTAFPQVGPKRPTGTRLDIAAYQIMAGTPQTLVDALDAIMMHNTMSVSMKNTIVQTVTNVASSNQALRTQTAIYLIATSSQYQVER
jgi:hypothetical protein